MQLTALASLLLTAVALSCPPPFSNSAFRANSTHSSAQLIKAALDLDGTLGWNEVVSPELSNPVSPWPKDAANVVFTHTINYCYEDEKTLDKVESWVNDAIALWSYK
jgi:hypothetical protein